jgi:flagellar motility protein MotE (MotC chaperone)
MTNHNALREFDEAQQDASAAARRRIEQAEEYRAHYRSRITAVQEGYYELAARQGLEYDPGFRGALQRVSDDMDENLRGADQVIAGLEDDLGAMTAQHVEEREHFLQQGKADSW